MKELDTRTKNALTKKLLEIKERGLNKWKKMSFYIDCEPIPMARPRTGKFGNIYVPKAQANKKTIRKFINLPENFKKIKTPIKMKVTYYFPYFYGISKIDKALIDEDLIHHITKPDIDNVTKTLLDALNDYVWLDDCFVFKMIIEKKYSDHPHIEVKLKYQKEILSNKQKTMVKHRKDD